MTGHIISDNNGITLSLDIHVVKVLAYRAAFWVMIRGWL